MDLWEWLMMLECIMKLKKKNEMSALPPRLACKGKHFEVPKQRRLAPFPAASDVVLIPYGGFLSHGVPPVIIHFFIGFSIPKPWGYNKSSIFLRIFREKNNPAIGVPPWFWNSESTGQEWEPTPTSCAWARQGILGTHSKKRRTVRRFFVGKAWWMVWYLMMNQFDESVWWIHSYENNTGWWFGTWFLWLSIYIGNVIIPTDFHSIIFQSGLLNHQPVRIPSGKRLHNHGKSPFYSWVNPLFLWPCSIANC